MYVKKRARKNMATVENGDSYLEQWSYGKPRYTDAL